MSTSEIELVFDESVLDRYDNYDNMESLLRAALSDFDGKESKQTQKEKDSKYGGGKRFSRGYNSK